MSIYEIQEKKNDLYFEYREFGEYRDLKQYPFGPLWIDENDDGVNKMRSDIKQIWIYRVSHFDDS